MKRGLPHRRSTANWRATKQSGILTQMTLHRNRVADLLKTLSPIQEKVVRLYFGLGCQRSHAAGEIDQEFQVSPQTIGGLLSGAVRRLRQAGCTASELRQAASLQVEVSRQRRATCRHALRFCVPPE